jgi:hypothetical protein
LIVAVLAPHGDLGDAAIKCTELDINGFQDWFLPSKAELNIMYHRRDVIGGFVGHYWSSSQLNNTVWNQSLTDGELDPAGAKCCSLRVRAIRAF